MNVVVVGAGISGCVCAWRLAKSGHDVTLVEKGRGVGGRMSTRRMGGAQQQSHLQTESFFCFKNFNREENIPSL